MSDGGPLGVPEAPGRDVACVGDNCVDVLRSRGGREVAGGNAFNVAVALARNHRLASSYFGAVGRDARGDLILEAARAAGVDVGGTERRPGPTGVTIVDHADDGERTFAHEEYGVSAEYRIAAAAGAAIAAHRWIHLARQPDYAALSARVRAGRTEDGRRPGISYDAGDHTSPGELALIAACVDVLFVSATGPEPDARRIADETRDAGAPIVVVTRGEHGAIAVGGDRRFSQPALPVTRVVDTLGAGDAFIAGFLSSLLDDGDDVAAALRGGAAAGAAAVAGDLYTRPPTIAEALQ